MTKLRYDIETLNNMSLTLRCIAFKMRQHLSTYAKKKIVSELRAFAETYEYVNSNWANSIELCATLLEDARDYVAVNNVDMQLCEIQKDISAARGN